MGLVTKDDGWRISDELWSKMEPLLPKPKKHPLGCHRPRVPNRKAMNAIFFILRTGAQWNSLDATGICSCSSAYRRFREWSDAGVFEEFWKQGVKRSLLTEAKGIPLSVVVDGANRHDMKLVKETLASLQADRPPATAGLPKGVCLDNWMNRFRRILVRWEKLAGTYPAMLHLACALITWRAVGLSK